MASINEKRLIDHINALGKIGIDAEGRRTSLAIPLRFAVRNTLAWQVCSRRTTRVFREKAAKNALRFRLV